MVFLLCHLGCSLLQVLSHSGWHSGMALLLKLIADTMLSGLSLQSLDSRLVLPELMRPMQTRSSSGYAGGSPLQQSALKHRYSMYRNASVIQ